MTVENCAMLCHIGNHTSSESARPVSNTIGGPPWPPFTTSSAWSPTLTRVCVCAAASRGRAARIVDAATVMATMHVALRTVRITTKLLLDIPSLRSQAATGFAETHAAAVKQTVMASENAMGMAKRYLQLTAVMAAKESANAHVAPRMSASVATGSRPNCQANIAAKRYSTPTENPAARKKSQYERLKPSTSK